MTDKDKSEYFIRRKDDINFEVAKFAPGAVDGGGQPEAVYNVIYDPAKGRGKCDCPAGTYRGTGINDKHVKLVKRWIESGEQLQGLTA